MIVPLLTSVSRFPVSKCIFTAVSLLQHARISLLCIKVQVVQLGTTTPDKMNTFSLSLCLLHRLRKKCNNTILKPSFGTQSCDKHVNKSYFGFHFRNFPVCALWSSTPFTVYENMALRLYFLKDCSLLLNDGLNLLFMYLFLRYFFLHMPPKILFKLCMQFVYLLILAVSTKKVKILLDNQRLYF